MSVTVTSRWEYTVQPLLYMCCAFVKLGAINDQLVNFVWGHFSIMSSHLCTCRGIYSIKAISGTVNTLIMAQTWLLTANNPPYRYVTSQNMYACHKRCGTLVMNVSVWKTVVHTIHTKRSLTFNVKELLATLAVSGSWKTICTYHYVQLLSHSNNDCIFPTMAVLICLSYC